MGGAVDQKAAVGVLEKILVQRAGIGGEFADDFLEDILDRDQSLDVAVFVDDETDAALVLAEVEQLRGQRRAFGNEVTFARQLDQAFRVKTRRFSSSGRILRISATPIRLSMLPV